MKLVSFVTVIALLLASQPTAFGQGTATTTSGPIRTSVQSMRWLRSADPAPRGFQGPLAPSGYGHNGRMTRRQVSILLGILGGAAAGFFVADSICNSAHHYTASECGLPGLVLGMPIGAAAGGITVAWLTK